MRNVSQELEAVIARKKRELTKLKRQQRAIAYKRKIEQWVVAGQMVEQLGLPLDSGHLFPLLRELSQIVAKRSTQRDDDRLHCARSGSFISPVED